MPGTSSSTSQICKTLNPCGFGVPEACGFSSVGGGVFTGLAATTGAPVAIAAAVVCDMAFVVSAGLFCKKVCCGPNERQLTVNAHLLDGASDDIRLLAADDVISAAPSATHGMGNS